MILGPGDAITVTTSNAQAVWAKVGIQQGTIFHGWVPVAPATAPLLALPNPPPSGFPLGVITWVQGELTNATTVAQTVAITTHCDGTLYAGILSAIMGQNIPATATDSPPLTITIPAGGQAILDNRPVWTIYGADGVALTRAA